jgi:hypothetical protein
VAFRPDQSSKRALRDQKGHFTLPISSFEGFEVAKSFSERSKVTSPKTSKSNKKTAIRPSSALHEKTPPFVDREKVIKILI